MSNINLHTCKKSAPGWGNKSINCKQCQKEKRDAKFFGKFPVMPSHEAFGVLKEMTGYIEKEK